MTVLHIEVQDQYVAPVRRARQCVADRGDRVVDDRVDVAPRGARSFKGFQVQRLRKRAVLQALAERGILSPQGSTRAAGNQEFVADRRLT